MIRCVHCNKENEDIFTYCLNCGKPLEQSLSSFRPRAASPAKKVSFKFEEVRVDGTQGEVFPLVQGFNTIGKSGGQVNIPDDPRVCDGHATLDVGADMAFLEDNSSVYGTFVRIRDEVALTDGDQLRIGHGLFQVQLSLPLPPPTSDGAAWLGSAGALSNHSGRLLRLGPDGVVLEAYLLGSNELLIGRTSGDVLMSQDPFVSSRHASISVKGGTCKLTDLGSTNGSFLKIRGRVAVSPGDVILIGQKLLRLRRVEG